MSDFHVLQGVGTYQLNFFCGHRNLSGSLDTGSGWAELSITTDWSYAISVANGHGSNGGAGVPDGVDFYFPSHSSNGDVLTFKSSSMPTSDLSQVLSPAQVSTMNFTSPSDDWRIVDIESLGASHTGDCRVVMDLPVRELAPGVTPNDIAAKVWTGSGWRTLPTDYFENAGVVEVDFRGGASTVILATEVGASRRRVLNLDLTMPAMAQGWGGYLPVECAISGAPSANWVLLMSASSEANPLFGQIFYLQFPAVLTTASGVLSPLGLDTAQIFYPPLTVARGTLWYWQSVSLATGVVDLSNPCTSFWH